MKTNEKQWQVPPANIAEIREAHERFMEDRDPRIASEVGELLHVVSPPVWSESRWNWHPWLADQVGIDVVLVEYYMEVASGMSGLESWLDSYGEQQTQ
jgi:hypothetical protein